MLPIQKFAPILIVVGCLFSCQGKPIPGEERVAISITSGNEQTGIVGSPLKQRFGIALVDNLGRPFSGQTVNWTTSAGSLASQTTISDDKGTSVGPEFTLPEKPGAVTVTASVHYEGSDFVARFNASAVIGPENQLVFATKPPTVKQYQAFSPPLQVHILDKEGNFLANSQKMVTLELAEATQGTELLGQTSVRAKNGIATFDKAVINRIGKVSLRATSPDLEAAVSQKFDVTDASLKLSAYPVGSDFQSAVVGTKVALQVRVLDGASRPVSQAAVQWESSNPRSKLAHTTSMSNSHGIAANQLELPAVAGSNKVTATIPASGKLASFTFQIDGIPGPRSNLVFDVQPSSIDEYQPMVIKVSIRDDNGNVDTQATDAVALSLAKNPAHGNIIGVASIRAIAGIATFSNFSVDTAGQGYTLLASAENMHAESNSFQVEDADNMVFIFGQSTFSAFTGSTVPSPFSVVVRGPSGDPVSGVSVRWTTIKPDHSQGASVLTTSNQAGLVASPPFALSSFIGTNEMQASIAQHPERKVSFFIKGVAKTNRMITKTIPGGFATASIVQEGNTFKLTLSKYKQDQSLDTFATGGIATIAPVDMDSVSDIAFQSKSGAQTSDAFIVVGNSVANPGKTLVLRVDMNGALDPGFSGSGATAISVQNVEGNFAPGPIAIDSANNILIAGSFSQLTKGNLLPPVLALIRLTPQGLLDSAFRSGGSSLFPNPAPIASNGVFDLYQASALTFDGGGNIVLAGLKITSGPFAANYFAIARFTAAGVIDSEGFGSTTITPGLVFIPAPGDRIANGFQAVCIQSNGKVLGAGSMNLAAQQTMAILRFDNEGLLDMNFGIGGVATAAISQTASVSALIETGGSNQQPRRIIAAGSGLTNAGTLGFAIARFDDTGFLDATFVDGGIYLVSSYGENQRCVQCNLTSLATSSASVIAAGSNFISIDRGSDFAIIPSP